MTDLVLRRYLSAADDGAGNVTVQAGPGAANESWHIDSISVSNTSTALIPTASVYRNAITPGSAIGGSYNGQGDTDSDANIDLMAGEQVYIQWTGGDSPSSATAVIEGTYKLRGVQIYDALS